MAKIKEGLDKRSTEIDLGLSKILEQEAPGSVDTAPGDCPSPKPSVSASDGRKDSPTSVEMEALANLGEWGRLATRCEYALHHSILDSDELLQSEVRLRWIEAQWNLGAVPVEILAAPLDSVTDRLESSPLAERNASVTTLAASLLRDLGLALEENGNSEIGGSFLARSESLAPRSSIGPSRSNDVNPLRTQVSPSGEINGRSDLPPRDKTEVDVSSSSRMSGRLFFLSLVCLTLLTVATLGSETLAELFSTQIGRIRLNNLDQSPRLVLDSPERSRSLSQLDAIFYDINRPRAERSSGESSSRPASASRASDPQVASPGGASVDTSGPIENEAVRDATASGAVEVGNSSATERDRDRGGKAGAIDPFDPKSVGSSPAGGKRMPVAKSVPGFESFPGGKSFSVLVRSEVMPSPSTRGAPLGEVRPGDIVTVEAQEGYWMRIRSKNGRVGYVLAQDLTPT